MCILGIFFLAVHFNAYCPSFTSQYCRVSALLELESLISQQALREAFSEAELLAAKKNHQQVQEHMQVRYHTQQYLCSLINSDLCLRWR